jgi:hypothetical protein
VLGGLLCAGVLFVVGGARRVYTFSEAAALRGSGIKATSTREPPTFARVHVDGATRVVITIGEPRSVVVETDDNVIDSVMTDVFDDELSVSVVGGWNSALGVVVRITLPSLVGVDVTGASVVEVDGLAEASFDVMAIDAAQVRCSGTATEVVVEAGGAAKVELAQLSSVDARVDATESASVDVRASGTLDASASGAARVRYEGDAVVTKRVTESGSVE